MFAWSTFDIIIVSLGGVAVVTYLVFKILKFKKNKNNPNPKEKKKGKADNEDTDIIDNE